MGVLTADVDEVFGLISCVMKWLGQVARLGHSCFLSAVVKWVSSVEARNKTMRRCQVRREVSCETCSEMGWLLSAKRDNSCEHLTTTKRLSLLITVHVV